MIIILLRFNGGSTGEGHDIAHIASSIFSPPCAGFFLRILRRSTIVPRWKRGHGRLYW